MQLKGHHLAVLLEGSQELSALGQILGWWVQV